MCSANRLEDHENTLLVHAFKNHTKIHEHDLVSIRTERETSIICSTCGLIYCEKCGKLADCRTLSTAQRPNNIFIL